MSAVSTLASLREYVFAGAQDALRWTQPGQDGLVSAAIPFWMKNCSRRYAEERAHAEYVDLGGEA